MNSLDRSLLEKSGYDNGWERVIESLPFTVHLASSRHSLKARIEPVGEENSYNLIVEGDLDLSELALSFPAEWFSQPGLIHPLCLQDLGRVLRRCAELAVSLPEAPLAFYEKKVSELTARDTSLASTEIQALVKQRVGQNLYRQALLDYWEHSCSVTGLNIPDLLRASHAKPWADCESAAERLSVYNGFLLSPNLDALFDSGFITFMDMGEIVVSKRLGSDQIALLGISQSLHLRWVRPAHVPYLQWHRERIFKA